jgi:hypothetical protein
VEPKSCHINSGQAFTNEIYIDSLREIVVMLVVCVFSDHVSGAVFEGWAMRNVVNLSCLACRSPFGR